MVINKDKIKNSIKKYNLIQFFMAALLFFISRKYIYYNVLQLDSDFFLNKICMLFISILFVVLWVTTLYMNIKIKLYKEKTNRNFIKDSMKYHKSYRELVEFFEGADHQLNIDKYPKQSLAETSGIIMGKKDGHIIYYDPNEHNSDGVNIIVFGSPGSGKSSSIIIPTAKSFGLKRNINGKLEQYGSVLCLDLKSELYNANKDFRNIKRFSTTHINESAHFDPLFQIRNMEPLQRVLALENIAYTLIPDENGENSNYFCSGSRDYFVGISNFLLSKNENISFPEIISQILLGNFKSWVIDILESGDEISSRYVGQFRGQNEKNLPGVYGKLIQCVKIFDSHIMRKLLTNDDINNLISNNDLDNGCDIYLQIQADELDLYACVITMIYETLLEGLLHRKNVDIPVCIILDELGQLKKIPCLLKTATLYRSYNISLLIAIQSISMIDAAYTATGRKTLFDSTKANIFLSVNDVDTRNWASTYVGKKKELKINVSEQGSGINKTYGNNISEVMTNIIEPEGFAQLQNKDQALIVFSNGEYAFIDKCYYYKEGENNNEKRNMLQIKRKNI